MFNAKEDTSTVEALGVAGSTQANVSGERRGWMCEHINTNAAVARHALCCDWLSLIELGVVLDCAGEWI